MLNSIPLKILPGKQLKSDLGLDNFRSVVIRKIINLPINIFLVFFNSKFPSTYIPLAKIRNLYTFTIDRLRREGYTYTTEPFRMSAPMQLANLSTRLPSNSIIIKVDITGEYYANKKLYKR